LLIGVFLFGGGFGPAAFPLGPSQAGFIEAEIVAHFMDDRRSDLVADFVLRPGPALERLLEDEDDVGRDVAVIGAALVQGDPVVEAEKIPGRPQAQVLDDLGGRKILHQHGHVLDLFPEASGQAVDRFSDELLEPLPGQGDHDRADFSIIGDWPAGVNEDRRRPPAGSSRRNIIPCPKLV
jgi:hypothetical protein